MEESSPGAPRNDGAAGTSGGLGDVDMDEGRAKAAAADAAVKEEAIKGAAKAAAREEELRQEGLSTGLRERKAAQEAEKTKEEMKGQMGALQVRGSLAEANSV